MERNELILGIIVDGLGSDAPTYQVISNGVVYEETVRLDTALKVVQELLEQRIALETRR